MHCNRGLSKEKGSQQRLMLNFLLTLENVLSVQILIAKSPLASFTSFVYTIKGEGLVLQGKSHRLNGFCKHVLLSAAHNQCQALLGSFYMLVQDNSKAKVNQLAFFFKP